jgi:hypothetical protein
VKISIGGSEQKRGVRSGGENSVEKTYARPNFSYLASPLDNPISREK